MLPNATLAYLDAPVVVLDEFVGNGNFFGMLGVIHLSPGIVVQIPLECQSIIGRDHLHRRDHVRLVLHRT